MDVFVIPVGPDQYELYCEQPVAGTDPIEPQHTGVMGTLRQRFRNLIRAAEERERRNESERPAAKTFIGRVQDRVMAWVAERIAEQRLLWNLRGESAVVAVHPSDMVFEDVRALILRTLQHDYERRRRWMIIDGLLCAVTTVGLGWLFILIPGVANLPAFYFGFRAAGHFLSMRGASHGLRDVEWSGRASVPLAELRGLGGLDEPSRNRRLDDVAAKLRLEHLPKFFDRVNRYNSGP
jgi:hypothetical protein